VASILHVLPHSGGGAETYLDMLEALPGLRQERVSLSRTRMPLLAGASIAGEYPRIARLAAKADVVHVHGDLPSIISLPLLAGAKRSVWTTHGLHFLRRTGPVRGPVARLAMSGVLRAANRTICTSEAERRELLPLVSGHLASRLVAIHNGIETPPPSDPAERRAARAELGLGDDDVAVLFLGQLEQRKDPLVAVAAAREVHRRGVPIVLLLAGDGPLADRVAEWSAEDFARPLGFRTDVQRLLAASDLFLMPSRHEGLSFAVLEAMGQGLPTVVSDGPGNPEAIDDAGVVVPRGDVWELANALEHLARDGDERRRLGEAARRRVAERLTADAFLEATKRVYDELLDGRAGGGAVAPAAPTAPARAADDVLA
jgi:glycosyltransferase involved in cell wall biosynthesis